MSIIPSLGLNLQTVEAKFQFVAIAIGIAGETTLEEGIIL